jgi:hypothetical protein
MDRLKGELGPDNITRQRAQVRCRHRKPQHCAATVGDLNIAVRARPGRRKAASVKRVPRISDGDRLDHLRFRIAPQNIKM